MSAMLADVKSIVGFGARRPGSAAGLAVESWLEARLRETGPGLSQVRREPVPVHRWEPRITSLKLLGPSGPVELPACAVPYTAWTAEPGARGRLVDIGDGSAPELDASDMRGAIALLRVRFGTLDAGILRRAARFVHDPAGTIPDGRLHEATWLVENFDAYYRAFQRGAIACVGWLGDSPIDGGEHWVPYDGFLKPLPAVWVGREHGATLRQHARCGSEVVLSSLGEQCEVDSHNVVAVLPGAASRRGEPGEAMLLTSHHDAPYASAVEDASGLAVLLAIARHLAREAASRPLERDLVFLAASGHFHGGIGCRSFVARHGDDLLPRLALALGVEHIAEEAEGDGQGGYRLTGRPEVRAFFADGGAPLLDELQQGIARHGLDRSLVLPAYLFGPEPPCDSAPFFTAGVPSICHIAGPLYLFDPHDTLDKVRAADLPRVASLFVDLVRRLDRVPRAALEQGMARRRGEPPPPPPAWFRPLEAYLGAP